METIRREEEIARDGQILLTGLSYGRGDGVEMIVLPQADKTRTQLRLTTHQLRQSGLIGKRPERHCSSAYARRLREQAQ